MADSIASLIARGPGKLDFSALMNTPEAFAQGQQIGADYRSRQALRSGLPRTPDGQIDFAAAADLLAKTGDREGAFKAAALATSNNNNAFDRQYKEGMLKVAQQNAARQDTPQQLQVLRAAGIDPASAEGRKALFPRTDTPISATDKKAIFEAEDAVPQLKGTIEALDRAAALNDKTFTGFGAEFFGKLGTGAAGALGQPSLASEQARATTEWSKIMGPEALQAMAGTLKGATTDFELRKFTEMLADPSTPADIRKGIIQRMKTLAERKLSLNEARIKDLRGGDYFKPKQATSDPLQMARDAIAKGAPRDAVIQRLQQNGIDPSGL